METLPRSISLVIPAYNEAAAIGHVVLDADTVLAGSSLSAYEILVVDDGSTDNTRGVLSALAATCPRLRVIHHQFNRGYGAALRSGFDAAACESVWLMDGDGQFDPRDLVLLMNAYAPRRLVTGVRINRNDRIMRKLNHWAFFGLVRLLFGDSAADVNCAFKLFPSALGKDLTSSGAVLCTELILRSRAMGYVVVDVPVRHLPRVAGRPTGARPAVIVRAFGELWRLWRAQGSRTAGEQRAENRPLGE